MSAPAVERHTFAVLVANEPGVLARVIGLFSGRGYNIESLTVAEIDRQQGLSRITLVTSGTRMVIDQIKAQLERLVPIYRVRDLTEEGPFVGRELALVKVSGGKDKQADIKKTAEGLGARTIESAGAGIVFEITEETGKVDQFLAAMGRLGKVEVARTGIAALSHAADSI